MPLSFVVLNQNRSPEKQALRGTLVMTLPRVDALGQPVTLEATIN